MVFVEKEMIKVKNELQRKQPHEELCYKSRVSWPSQLVHMQERLQVTTISPLRWGNFNLLSGPISRGVYLCGTYYFEHGVTGNEVIIHPIWGNFDLLSGPISRGIYLCSTYYLSMELSTIKL